MVLDGKESLNTFLESLWQLDEQKPELFMEVAEQMELDNGRWSTTSALPEVTVKRDKRGRVGIITFRSDDGDDQTRPGGLNPLVWCSNKAGAE